MFVRPLRRGFNFGTVRTVLKEIEEIKEGLWDKAIVSKLTGKPIPDENTSPESKVVSSHPQLWTRANPRVSHPNPRMRVPAAQSSVVLRTPPRILLYLKLRFVGNIRNRVAQSLIILPPLNPTVSLHLPHNLEKNTNPKRQYQTLPL